MAKQQIQVNVQILSSEQSLMCDVHERDLLLEACDMFNECLRELRAQSPSLSFERVVMMGGLQMAFNLLQERRTLASEVNLVNQLSAKMSALLEPVISELDNNNNDNSETTSTIQLNDNENRFTQ